MLQSRRTSYELPLPTSQELQEKCGGGRKPIAEMPRIFNVRVCQEPMLSETSVPIEADEEVESQHK